MNDQKIGSSDGFEIERKWILRNLPENFHNASCVIVQGYLFADGAGYLRLRKSGDDQFFMTVKSKHSKELSEWEITIPNWVFDSLWPRVENRIVSKRRCVMPTGAGDLQLEVDLYDGNLQGLITVEVEFASREEADAFILPSWLGEAVDVTDDRRFSNLNMAIHGLPGNRPFVDKQTD